MCSVPGYDASGHVEDLAAEQNTQITSIAIGKKQTSVFVFKTPWKVTVQLLTSNPNLLPVGSAEGFNQADKAINTAVKSGR